MKLHEIITDLKIVDNHLQLSTFDNSGHYLAMARITIAEIINRILISKEVKMIRHLDALELAFEFIGLTERRGLDHNPEILSFFHAIGHTWVLDDETPWCAAFVGAVLKKAGYEHTGKLNARSYLTIGEPIIVPELGVIAVFYRGNKDGASGHVGFYLGESENDIYVLGGNQSDKVNVSSYQKSKLLGYRRLSKNESN